MSGQKQGAIGAVAVAGAAMALAVTPAAVTMQPGMVQGMADWLGLTLQQAGYVCSAEVFGIMAGTIVFALVAKRVSWRGALISGLVLALALNLCSIGQRDYGLLLAVRGVVGFGCGLATAVGWSVLGEMRDPSRYFGWATAGIILFAAIGFALLPMLFEWAGYAGFLIFLSCAVAVCLPLAAFVKSGASAADAVAAQIAKPNTSSGALALISFLSLSAAYPMAWTYMALVGSDAGLNDAVVASVFSTTQFFGVAGAALMGVIGARFGYLGPAILALGSGAVAIFSLTGLHGELPFFAANATFQFAWNAGIPIVLGVIAAAGGDGGLFRYAIPLQFVGMAAAPAIAASLLRGENYQLVIYAAVILAVISLFALWPLILKNTIAAHQVPASRPIP